MMRVFLMLLCFALAGLNAWVIATIGGGVFNWIAMFTGIGTGIYGIASLVRYP